MKKLRLSFTYWQQLGKMTTMKMNRIIPVILVTVVLVTGSLVNAYSLNISGKLRIDSKKNFLVSRAESKPGNTSDNTIFESYKGTIASSEVIRMDAYSGSTITPYYFHTNAIGSTTAVTDANGQVVERYKYGLYGMPTFMDAASNVMSKSAIGNNILFQGREYEPETNFYYFRARHLDPIMGRFLQTDPMGYQDSLNLYQSFNMNPVNFVDPFGKQHQVTVTPEGAEFERPMTVREFWETLMEAGVIEEEALIIIAESTYYSKYFWDGSLVDRIKTHQMDLSLTDSEARALGMEYNLTIKGPREQFGRLFRGEFKEFGKAALENLDRAFGDPENAALMFSGGVKTKGAKPYPILNKRGILQWKDSSTGQFTKSPVILPEGVEWPKGFGDPTKWKTMLKDLTVILKIKS